MSTAHRLRAREIRLISIVPAEPSEALQCISRITNLDESIDYDALSYVWGASTLEIDLQLSGRLRLIQFNLGNALRVLRTYIAGRWLWVDQLCINQDDIEEKTHQVLMMADIYKKANITYAFLHDDGCQNKPDFNMADILQQFVNSADQALMELASSPWWFYILVMLRHEWWQRVWTAQEMILAKDLTFIYAKKTFTYTLLLKFFQIFERVEEVTRLDRAHGEMSHVDIVREVASNVRNHSILVNVKQHVAAHGHAANLVELLSVCRDRKTSRLVDKVYGLAGLYLFPPGFVDYLVLPQKCFERLAMLLIREHQNLDIFYHILSNDLSDGSQWSESKSTRGVPDNVRLPEIPSWVPDWSQRFKITYKDLLDARLRLLRSFNAAGSTVPQIRLLENGELSIKGIRCDIVDKLDDDARSDLCGPIKERFESWIRLAGLEGLDPYDTTYTQFREALTAGVTITFHSGRLGLAKLNDTSDLFVHDVWRSEVMEKGGFTRLPELHTLNRVDLYFRTIDAIATDRRFATTKAGLLGWVPRDTQKGDIICVFFGSTTASVLRQSPGGTGKWRFVGYAVLHGYMWGEVLVEADEGRMEPSVFTLV